jgi:ribosomal protein L23
MSTSFKRVISHPEELGNLNKKMSMGVNENVTDEVGNDSKLPATSEDETLPAAIIIENDEAQPERESPVALFRGISTLTDNDKSARFDTEESLSQSGLSRNELNLARLDSRASDAMVRSQRAGSGSSGTFGWFIDVHGGESTPKLKEEEKKVPAKHLGDDVDDGEESTQFIDISQQARGRETPSAMAVTAPPYILEENLSTQMLWRHTAGNRPPQPAEERAYYEMIWRQNFALSNVEYSIPPESLNAGTSDHTEEGYSNMPSYGTYTLATDFMATDAEVAEAIERLHGTSGHMVPTGAEHTKPTVVNKQVKGAGSSEDLTVLIKGDNAFGTTVSKSFERIGPNGNREVDTVNISVASYRVVESKKYGKYAQFLVIYREGSIRDTIGVWKRYSDFEALSRRVVESQDGCHSVLANMSPLAVTEEGDVEHLPNAITSWRLFKKRQRWFRCLDAGYLSLKVFLLERFLHDILFESSSPNLLRDFVIYDKSRGSN